MSSLYSTFILKSWIFFEGCFGSLSIRRVKCCAVGFEAWNRSCSNNVALYSLIYTIYTSEIIVLCFMPYDKMICFGSTAVPSLLNALLFPSYIVQVGKKSSVSSVWRILLQHWKRQTLIWSSWFWGSPVVYILWYTLFILLNVSDVSWLVTGTYILPPGACSCSSWMERILLPQLLYVVFQDCWHSWAFANYVLSFQNVQNKTVDVTTSHVFVISLTRMVACFTGRGTSLDSLEI